MRELRSDKRKVQERIESAILQHASRTSSQKGTLKLSSIYLPKSPEQEIWRVWYDLIGEDHYWYGAETQNWEQIVPFTED